MNIRQQQYGMTIWSLMFLLAVFGFFLFIGFRLLPAYLDDFKVKSIMDAVAKQQDAGSLSKAAIASTLEKRFDIDNVGIKPAELNRALSVETRGRQRVIRLNYQLTIPMVYNASVLLEFDHVREVRAVE